MAGKKRSALAAGLPRLRYVVVPAPRPQGLPGLGGACNEPASSSLASSSAACTRSSRSSPSSSAQVGSSEAYPPKPMCLILIPASCTGLQFGTKKSSRLLGAPNAAGHLATPTRLQCRSCLARLTGFAQGVSRPKRPRLEPTCSPDLSPRLHPRLRLLPVNLRAFLMLLS